MFQQFWLSWLFFFRYFSLHFRSVFSLFVSIWEFFGFKKYCQFFTLLSLLSSFRKAWLERFREKKVGSAQRLSLFCNSGIIRLQKLAYLRLCKLVHHSPVKASSVVVWRHLEIEYSRLFWFLMFDYFRSVFSLFVSIS